MTFTEIQKTIEKRLDEGGAGDRGWWIITRVHVSLGWIVGIARFLSDRGRGRSIVLSEQDYAKLAKIAGATSANPGQQLRRHHLLVMDNPLRLIERVNGNQWREIALTEAGQALAASTEPSEVLEKTLSDIWFARTPWYSQGRVDTYGEFDVQPYRVTSEILSKCDGFIDRDEFDLVLSRVRSNKEIDHAVDQIKAFRKLTQKQKSTLLKCVKNRIANKKSYDNWRDVSLHTFSLFSLGNSFIRQERTLRLVSSAAFGSESKPTKVKESDRTPFLKIELEDCEELLTPPASPLANTGTEGESLVAKLLRADGFQVAFYSNRRGFGFDLWAKNHASAFVVEVKSSMNDIGAINLTPMEYEAAKHYGNSFVLAIVDRLSTKQPRVRWIQDPASKLKISQKEIVVYSISKPDWEPVAKQAL